MTGGKKKQVNNIGAYKLITSTLRGIERLSVRHSASLDNSIQHDRKEKIQNSMKILISLNFLRMHFSLYCNIECLPAREGRDARLTGVAGQGEAGQEVQRVCTYRTAGIGEMEIT